MHADSLELARSVHQYVTVEGTIVSPIVTLSLLFFVYGIYTIIFAFSIQALIHRRKGPWVLYLKCTIILFALASFYAVSEAYGLTLSAIIRFRALKTDDYAPLATYIDRDERGLAWVSMINITSSLMNVVADVMLIHRCWILWDCNKRVLVSLVIPAIVLNVLWLATGIMCIVACAIGNRPNIHIMADRIAQGTGFAIAIFNIVLSLMTGGRIWWMSRGTLGKTIAPRYRAIIAVILESGILYPTALVAAKVSTLTLDHHQIGVFEPFDPSVVAFLLAGLAPTLIIVRVAYGSLVETTHQPSFIFFAERESRHEIDVEAPQTIMDIRPQIQRESLEADMHGVRLEKEKTNESRV
ncbi:hypothetical protein PM082_002278 [Marasmius tenuissimus]|nr:hypothetical protein PM082_002278 [Marasmius tenuissimus]